MKNYISSKTQKSTTTVDIFYNDYGQGDPVILIHGWPLSNEMWEYQIESLVNSGFRVISYDRRGFGKSSKPWDGYDYDTMTEDLNNLIKELKLTNITLVGFSMGGGEVVRYFSKFGGEGIKKVILISSVTPFLLKTDTNTDGVPQETFDKMVEQMKTDRIGFLDDFGKTFFGVDMLHKPLSEPLMNYYRMLCSLASPRATVECAKAFATTDFRKEMSGISVPTLIIHGNKDKTVPIDPTANQSAKLISNNKFIVYDGAPHGLFYTEMDRLNNDILNFLKAEQTVPKIDQLSEAR